MKLHSDLHEWDLNSFVPPMEDLGLPQQSQFHRKETLCLLILDYLGESYRSVARLLYNRSPCGQAEAKLGRTLSISAKNWHISMLKSHSISELVFQ